MNPFKLGILSLIVTMGVNPSNAQYQSTVLFQGNKTLVLAATGKTAVANGVLSTGEIVSSGRDHGAAYFTIVYKGKHVFEPIGEDFENLKIYEYDFGGNGDKELVVQVGQKKIGRNGCIPQSVSGLTDK